MITVVIMVQMLQRLLLIKVPSNTGPTGRLTDISINDISANTRYDLSVNQINSNDISNDKIGLYVVTRPTDFVASDITQNIGASTYNKLVMNVSHSQVAGSLDISGYTFDVSGTNFPNATLQTITKTATTKTATATNVDISLSDLSANTRYDLSINQFNIYDISNSKVAEYAVTRPTDFVASDITQNIGDSTYNKLVMNISHSQVAGSLDISGYTVDVSGNNGVNATLQTIVKTATTKTATATNTDVSFSDLSANTRYDLSINQFNIYDISNSKATEYAVTRPTNFSSSDVSQNISSTTSSMLVFNVIKGQVSGSLDISGFTVDISGNNGSNATKQTIIKKPSNADANGTLTDVSCADLSANTYYDLSINMFNEFDMSNAKLDLSGTTRPESVSTTDISQNRTYSTTNATFVINNSQVAATLDINSYNLIFNNSISLTASTLTTPYKHSAFATGTEGNDYSGKCGSVNFATTGYDGTGSHLPGSGNTTAQICWVTDSAGNTTLARTTSGVSFWFKGPDDSETSDVIPIFSIDGPNAVATDRWGQLIIKDDLLVYGTDNNNIKKLYVDGVTKTLPSYSTETGLTGSTVTTSLSHTALRGWHHYYMEFGNDMPTDKAVVFLRGYDGSQIGAPTNSGVDEIRFYSDAITEGEITRLFAPETK